MIFFENEQAWVFLSNLSRLKLGPASLTPGYSALNGRIIEYGFLDHVFSRMHLTSLTESFLYSIYLIIFKFIFVLVMQKLNVMYINIS